MKQSWFVSAMGVALVGACLSSPAEARHHHRHYRSGHGDCLRFNKTTGTVAGAVGGGVLGKVLLGGPAGMVVGAAAGGIAGHELAHNRRKHC